MKLALSIAVLVLVLTFCRDTAVNGFSFLSPPTLSQSSSRNRDALVVGASSSTTVFTPKRQNGAATMFMMTFWEGITQGVGGAREANARLEKQKCPVLICPAQLSVPGDYRQMIADLKERGFPAYVADLTRFGWIAGLLPSALSPEYFKGELIPAKTLGFYYEAIDRALAEIQENHPGAGVHVVGHSIGGWVARAWVAEGCSSADRDSVLSLTTLGTPNRGPKEENAGAWTSVDQTRGLLKNINARFPGAHVEGVRYTSVAGTALDGKFPGSIEEMLAFVSYLPLSGDGRASGDGIIPRDVAALEGSTVVEIPTSKHSGFVPFPGKAIDLGEEFLWYGSPSLMGQWVGNLDAAERRTGVARGGEGGRFSGGWPW